MTERRRRASRVLIVCDWFPPSTKSGGPARSLASIVETESTNHQIRVITRDRDLGDTRPYEGLQPRTWVCAGSAAVLRTPPRAWSIFRHLRRAAPGADLIYLNSVFSPLFGLLPLLLQFVNLTPRKPILLAPRGELALAALAVKPRKKRPAAVLVRYLVSQSELIWHASSEREAADIRDFVAPSRALVVIQNDPPPTPESVSSPDAEPLTIAFVGRMVPIKNFEQLAHAASLFEGPLHIVVVGHLEDPNYWEHCRAQLAGAGESTRITVMGHIEHEDVRSVMGAVDALVLPTRGENFGHAIAEAMAVGCPVMIPDTTMWTRTVQAGGGWLIDTDDSHKLVVALRELAATPHGKRLLGRERVRDTYARWWAEQREDSTSLFEAAVTLLNQQGNGV